MSFAESVCDKKTKLLVFAVCTAGSLLTSPCKATIYTVKACPGERPSDETSIKHRSGPDLPQEGTTF